MSTLKTLKTLSILCLLICTLAACTDEDAPIMPSDGQPVKVTLRLSVAGNEPTRADALLDPDTNATEAEMMKNWTVIVVNSSGVIEYICSKSEVQNLEKDVVTDITLQTGEKTIYSFANIADISSGLSVGSAMPDWSAKTHSVAGNGFDPSTSGIPMSNKQTVSITASTTSVDLIVVRMLAKMEFQFTNATASDIIVNSITLSEITQNVADNLYLLPKYQTGEEVNGPDDMAAGDLQPNLVSEVSKADFSQEVTLTVPGNTSDATTATTTTFYLNESQATAAYPGYFVISLSIDRGDAPDELRYALLEWKEITRNDYRIIPIRLDDYALEILPYDFPPIGVYPASVKEEDGKFTCTFHAGGDFYVVPRVKQLSASSYIDQSAWDIYSADGSTPLADESQLAPTSITNEAMYVAGGTLTYDADGRWSGGISTKYFKGIFAEEQTGTAEYDFTVKVTDTNSVTRLLKYKLYLIREE